MIAPIVIDVPACVTGDIDNEIFLCGFQINYGNIEQFYQKIFRNTYN